MYRCRSSPGRTGRGQLISSKLPPDDTADRLEITVDEQSHRDCSGVPTTCCESTENGPTSRLLIQMKRLGIELPCEGPNALPTHSHLARSEGLTDREIL